MSVDDAQLTEIKPVPVAFERRISLLMTKISDEAISRALPGLAELGLDPRAYVTLTVLAEDKPRSQLELARIMGRVPGLMVSVIDELEADGFVARRRSSEDRRRTIVELTDRGREIFQQADALAERVEDELFSVLTEDRRRELHAALRDVMCATWRGGDC